MLSYYHFAILGSLLLAIKCHSDGVDDLSTQSSTETSGMETTTETVDSNVECCYSADCHRELGQQSYCSYTDYVNSTKCSEKGSRRKRNIIINISTTTTEIPLDGIAGTCFCQITYTVIDGQCRNPSEESDESESTQTPTSTESNYQEYSDGTSEETTVRGDSVTQGPCGATVNTESTGETAESTTCRDLSVNDPRQYEDETVPTSSSATDLIVTTTVPSGNTLAKICYNWTCMGQNCSGQVVERNSTCVKTGGDCFLAKQCLEVYYEYIFSCTDPCANVSQGDCYSESCTSEGCNNDTSVVEEYICFTSAGGPVSLTRIAIGFAFILPNIWSFISPL